MRKHTPAALALAASFVMGAWCNAQPTPPFFSQLNHFGTSSSTPDSSWGRVTYDYLGHASPLYFNLKINGNWVVQNLSIGSPLGVGISQQLSTFFDFGTLQGVDVPSVQYGVDLGVSPLLAAPLIASSAIVGNLDFQIGGEIGIDLGSPGPSLMANTTDPVTGMHKLPQIDKLVNQPQGVNECAPGAISNSLNYLHATGRIGFGQTIDQVKPWVGWTPDGTPSSWYQTKKDYLEPLGVSVRYIDAPLSPAGLADLIAELEDGQDIEVDLEGHVAMLVGVRVHPDGTLDFDLADDNQLDNLSDPIRTVRLVNGALDGMRLERFVVECPEPATLGMLAFGGMLLARRRE